MNESQQQPTEKSDRLKVRYMLALGFYIFVMAVLTFNFSLRSTVFIGIVVGSIFPFITFLYVHKNYITRLETKSGKENQKFSMLSWVLPALFLHLIIIFGFNITISGPINKGFKSSLYSSFYKYSKIFEKFSESDLDSLEKDRDKLKHYVVFYGSFFEEQKKEKKQTRFEQLLQWFKGAGGEKSTGESALDTKNAEAVRNGIEAKGAQEADEEYLELIKRLSSVSERIGRIPFYVAITFGFLGALIFCFSDTINRYNNVDLYPKVYVFYIIRFIIACSLAVALSSFIMTDFSVILAPFIFFGIGYFPERAIKYMDDKMTQYLGIESSEYEPMPLTLVQGLSPEKAFRLREIGIVDVQHLAMADIEFLEKNLPYNRELLCDWMAQSILYLQFPNHVELLRKLGIRTILQLKELDLSSPPVQKQVEHQNIEKKELEQIEYLKYVVSLPHINNRICKLTASSEAD